MRQPEPNRDWNRNRNGNDGNRNWGSQFPNQGHNTHVERRDDNRRWDNDRNRNSGRDWNTNRNYGNNGYRNDDYGNNSRSWNRDWRRDNRYDWQGYRNQYRNRYRVSSYYNPYGYDYGYSRFSIGYYMDSLFYSSRYWISDPWQYRLPAVYGPYRWVRYYNDVLLVDVRSGEVVDVIRDFFW